MKRFSKPLYRPLSGVCMTVECDVGDAAIRVTEDLLRKRASRRGRTQRSLAEKPRTPHTPARYDDAPSPGITPPPAKHPSPPSCMQPSCGHRETALSLLAEALCPHIYSYNLGELPTEQHNRLSVCLLIAETLVLGLLLGSTLRLLCHPRHLLLGFVGLLLRLLYEGVAGLPHHLVLLCALRDGEPYSRPR